MTEPHLPTRKLVVIGLGLIGGSLAAAAKKRGLCTEVLGVARRDEVCAQAIALDVVDRATTELKKFAAELGAGDVIFIAVPTLTVGQVLADIRACISDDVTITDGASVKGSVAADVKRLWGGMPANVVLGHPIAGSEKSGVEAANPDLYERHRVILTPTAATGADHLARVTQLWQAVGAEVLHLDIQEHDDILAATSHLPHVIAYSLVDTLAHDSQNQNIFRYAAGGFRDFTRIASSDAIMWRDIMLANREAILQAIDLFALNLAGLRTAIQAGDAKHLTGVFSRAKAARDHFTKMLAQKAYREPLADKTCYRVAPGDPLEGSLVLPGDKSIAHRAIMLAAIAEGVSHLRGVTESEHTLASIQAFRDMGVVIDGPHHGEVTVYGVGLHGLKPPAGALYLGNSAISLRLLLGLLAGQGFAVELAGDRALNQRPLQRVVEPLTQMGAQLQATAGCKAPVQIAPSAPLQAITYTLPVASAQVKSALLLAGLYAQGTTKVVEPAELGDHTERMLAVFGVTVVRQGTEVSICGGQTLRAADCEVPGDFSAALFFIGAALVVPGSSLTLARVGINPTRIAAVDALRSLGADIRIINESAVGGEPWADIRAQASKLRGAVLPASLVQQLADELPSVVVLAALGAGQTVLEGAEQAFAKDAARLHALLQGLGALGLSAELTGGNLVVHGATPQTAELDCAGEPTLALALALAGLACEGGALVKNCGALSEALPGFASLALRAGISLDVFNS